MTAQMDIYYMISLHQNTRFFVYYRYMKYLPKISAFSIAIAAAFLFTGSLAYADATAMSRNWAGYETSGSGYTAVGATWVVPTVSDALDPAADATWVGIGGVSTGDLIQSGTQAIVEGGQVTYQAWVEMLPQELKAIPLQVHAGDSVTVALNQTSAGEWHLSFKDTTTGGDYETDMAYASSLTSAEWIQEKPTVEGGGSISLDMFSPVQFTNAYTVENGVRRTIAQSNPVSIGMLNGNGSSLAAPSALGADGASFTVTRSTSTAPVSTVTSYTTNPQYNQQSSLPPWKRTAAATGTSSVSVGFGNGSRPHRVSVTIQRFTVGPGSTSISIESPTGSSVGLSNMQLPEAEVQIIQQLLQNLANNKLRVMFR